MSWPEPIRRALARTPGATFHRCALQVNPFAYVVRHGKQTAYTNEDAYNADLVQACQESGVNVVGLTDHHTVATTSRLRARFEDSGIAVFPGFEVYSKDGVHALVLFDPSTSDSAVERWLGHIGVTDPDDANGLATADLRELLDQDEWPAVVVPEATWDRGLLTALKDSARRNAWRHDRLLAVQIPAPVDRIKEQDARDILRGAQPEYTRDHPPALIFARDICDPSTVGAANASTWLKMTKPTIDGLRAAFRDPESRVRLPSAAEPPAHPQVEAIAWTGGFLDGCALRLGENLNVLIGGRGAGKSTVIESLRYALDLPALGDASQRTLDGVVKNVLCRGTVVHVLVSSPYPKPARYMISRTVPQAPVVLDEDGTDLALQPGDVVRSLAVWGQHEIAELEDARAERRRLIERFAPTDVTRAGRKADIEIALRTNAARLHHVEGEHERIDAKLARLPALQERLGRYEQAGIEQRLGEQTLYGREEGMVRTAERRLIPAAEQVDALAETMAVDLAFIAESARADLPNSDLLTRIEAVLTEFQQGAESAAEQLRTALDRARDSLNALRQEWDARRSRRQDEFDARLRELQASDVDANEFLDLRQELESLLPLTEERGRLRNEESTLNEERASLMERWRDLRQAELDALRKAADHVNQALDGRVRVRLVPNASPAPLMAVLREHARAGEGSRARLGETERALEALGSVEPADLAARCRDGVTAVERWLDVPTKQAALICGGGEPLFRAIEELDLETVLTIELNVGSAATAVWRRYDSLSKGQAATAALLLLLLGQAGSAERAGPLIIDQPEDDLDHKFVFDSIVPAMREEKRRRQFIFATHDPNIPVLGDAELIAVLEAREESGRLVGTANDVGSIDVPAIREHVEENLEGGRDAFERRRWMYGLE